MNNSTQYLLEQYFTPGRTVKAYAGLDKVISFNWNNGSWNVIVQAVKANGTIDSRYPHPRCHATMPEIEEMQKIVDSNK